MLISKPRWDVIKFNMNLWLKNNVLPAIAVMVHPIPDISAKASRLFVSAVTAR
jgi:sulfur relay (sulfurtransferase) DsrC/TusE family protein